MRGSNGTLQSSWARAEGIELAVLRCHHVHGNGWQAFTEAASSALAATARLCLTQHVQSLVDGCDGDVVLLLALVVWRAEGVLLVATRSHFGSRPSLTWK
eukprot:620082-Amphidinium_carterae.1